MEESTVYLVPYDFTTVGESALEYALNLADATSGMVHLLHVVSAEDDLAWAMSEFHKSLQKLGLSSNKRIVLRAVIGDIYKDIAAIAEREKATLIIMGTHGATGLQKIFGSRAIKVITSSYLPFIIVQQHVVPKEIGRIVMPLTMTKESVRALKFATDLAEKFMAEIHIVGSKQHDEWLENKIQANIAVAKNYMAARGIKFEVEILTGTESFQKQVIEYGIAIDADLFALAYFPESFIDQFDTFAQEMLTDKSEIPVLIVNAKAVTSQGADHFFVGM